MRGGKRKGAGRKPGKLNFKRREMLKVAGDDISATVLGEVDRLAIWKKLLSCNSPRVILATMEYLTDRVYGRPVQMLQGDVNRPISIHLSWGAATPEWMQPAEPEPIPVSSRLAIPIEAIVSDSNKTPND